MTHEPKGNSWYLIAVILIAILIMTMCWRVLTVPA